MNRRRKIVTSKSAPYFFLLPTLILFACFTVYPIVQSLVFSFMKISGNQMEFVGIQNYIRLFKDTLFLQSLRNTLIFLVIQVPVMILLAMMIACALNSKLTPGRTFFRTAYFLPATTSLVVAAILFSVILMEDGMVNNLLMQFHFIEQPVKWLNSAWGARASIMLVLTWRWTGYNTIILLAGLQAISEDIYEAADVDGASALRKFFYITLPSMKPIILFTTILSTIGTLQMFDESMILTKGGPANATVTMGYYLYQQGFRNSDFGYSSALAYVVVILTAVLSYFQFRVGEEK